MTPTDKSPAVEWLAGGTDLMERRRSGVSHGPVRPLPDEPALHTTTWSPEGAASIGAAVTIDAVARDPRLAAAYPGLTATAAGLATPEIRRMATLGGNIAQRSRCWYYRNPAIACLKKGGSDCPARSGNHLYGVAFDLGPCIAPHPSSMAVALLAYDARITTSARDGAAVTALLGPGTDATRDHLLAADERILTIHLPRPAPGEYARYRRAISRAAAEWPLVEIVCRLSLVGDRVQAARIAVGGVAPVPIRLPQVETILVGASATSLPVAQARAAAIEGARPLAGTAYKLVLLQGLIEDVLALPAA